MKTIVSFGLIALSVLFAPALSRAEAGNDVKFSNAYTHVVHRGAQAIAIYGTLHNDGTEKATIVGGHVPEDIAEGVELHKNMQQDGIMMMRPVEVIEIMPNYTVVLDAKGLHMMVLGMKKHFTAGDTIPLTVNFNDGSAIRTQVKVMPIGEKAGQAAEEMDHSGHHHH